MSILSKLFGSSAKAEKVARELLRSVTQGNPSASSQPSAPQRTQASPAPQPAAADLGPSGESWGPIMPAEENQYNFGGTYIQYFEQIFRTEFSSYRLENAMTRDGKRTVFTFWDGTRKALVVELLFSSSASAKLRQNCAAQGVPYLRFYYDHPGWWNTRSYVVKRVRNALA
jgi:hypothetical protein